jgi:hypothetical protein
MRIITRKLYRAFPELDAFTDDQCRQYLLNIRQSKQQYSLVIIGIPTLLGLVHLFGLPYLLSRFVMRWVYRSFKFSLSQLDDTLFLLVIGTFLIVWLGGSAFWPLYLRDRLLGAELVKVLNNQLRKTRCRTCSYSLIGQTPAPDGSLICPECGSPTTMQTLGITQEDLIPPR